MDDSVKVRLVRVVYADGFERLRLEEWNPHRLTWMSIYERVSSETYDVSCETENGG